jgi:signal transduction histidine kinase/DNA-binding response OmpR family regulator
MIEESKQNKYQKILEKYHRWVTKSVSCDGDNEDTLLLKRIHWRMCVGTASNPLPVIIIWHILGLKYWTIFGVVYVVFNLINLIIFYLVRRGVEWFALSSQLFHVFFSFAFVLFSGGILISGGMVFAGIFGPFYALMFSNRKRAIAILILYLITLVIEVLIQPYLVPYQPVTPLINIVFFVANFSAVITVFFFMLDYYANQSIILKQTEARKLRELDAIKTNIYTNITHEFRTPLSIIIGLAEQLADNPKMKLDEGLQIIKRNGKSLLRLISQMLDLSKLEAKAMPANLFQGDIIGYLKYIIESFESLAQSKNINLHFTTEIDHLIMDFDAEKMIQIISNLLSNSIKFTPCGGDIYLLISKEITNNTNQLNIKVRDTGIGIPADKLPNIFDRFYKVDNDSSIKAEGTGIGLALLKELVTLLKGKIKVESELSKGTEVTIILPITNKAELKHDVDLTRLVPDVSSFIPENNRESFSEQEKTEITKDLPILLIVEDNLDVTRYLKSLLITSYNVYMAMNGREGLDKALELIPDIVISDVMMPEMDGFTLCEKLKTDERTSHIPVILLTARSSDVSKLEGLETGADDYLIKPVNAKELLTRIKNLIEQRRRLRERFSRDVTLSPKDIAVTSADQRFLEKAIEIVEKEMKEPDFSVEQFSKEVGMSTSQLYRKIHALTNQSPVEFIRTFRLKRAAFLLKQKFGNVAEIAFEVGFNNLSYFAKCFRELFGKSPSEYSKLES